MKGVSSIYLILILIIKVLTISADLDQNEVNEFFDKYYKWKLKTWPEESGDSSGERFRDLSVEGYKKIASQCKKYKIQANNMIKKYESQKGRNLHYLKLLRREVSVCEKSIPYQGYLLQPINFRDGVQNFLPGFFKNMQPKSLEEYRKCFEQLKQVATYLQKMQNLLQMGLTSGIAYYNDSIGEPVLKKLHQLQDEDVEASTFFKPFQTLEESETSDEIMKIQNEAKTEVKENILPTLKKFTNFIENVYTKKGRPGPGLVSGGEKSLALYHSCLRWHTTVKTVTPKTLHDLGVKESSELKIEMEKVSFKLGLNLTFIDFMKKLQNDKESKFKDVQQALTYFRKALKKINPSLKKVLPEEMLTENIYGLKVDRTSQGTFAHYVRKSGDTNGLFMVNDKVQMFNKYQSMVFALHEGNPGHHFQFTSLNLIKAPKFVLKPFGCRDIPSCPPTNMAHSEGWGLYSESLGVEMGLFDTESNDVEMLYDLVGYYSLKLMRAVRLIVDTGMHGFGWSKEKAISYIVDNTDANEVSAKQQIRRYINQPGQATSYKIGYIFIKNIRKKREEALKDKFDLRQFHLQVLNCLGPLDFLEECVEMEEKLWANGDTNLQIKNKTKS